MGLRTRCRFVVILCMHIATLTSAFTRSFFPSTARFSQSRSLILQMSSFSSAAVAGTSGPPQALVAARVRQALERAFGADGQTDPLIFLAKPEFGDYQCNAAMSLAKKLKMKPQEVATKIAAALAELDEAEGSMLLDLSATTVSGPGFVNLRLAPQLLNEKLIQMYKNEDGRLGVLPASPPLRVVVDYSSPNIAKDMHVGHLRSTIIGDSLARLHEFLGHDVLRLNHVGDWGTQFGMLITFLNKEQNQGKSRDNIKDLVEFYKAAKKQFDEDPVFQETSRNEVVKLQSGDVDTLKAWQDICDLSRREFSKIYDLLKVTGLEERGESFYNPFLAELVQELEASGIATVSDGALCVFLPGYNGQDGTPLPLLIRKSDGGFLYATTDLAAVRHRTTVEKADRILYVTDVGQSQHFAMVFDASRKAKLLPDHVELKHVPFGLVQGEDGKKFATRAGVTVKLKDLLDEAVRVAAGVLAGGEPAAVEAGTSELDLSTLSEEQLANAKVIGIGAVKYADLSMNRESNYRFRYGAVCWWCWSWWWWAWWWWASTIDSSHLFPPSLHPHPTQLQEDAIAAGQHGSLHAVRVCPHPGHSAQGRGTGGPRRIQHGRERAAAAVPRGAPAGRVAAALRRGAAQRRARPVPLAALRVPLRPQPEVQPVLRKVPRAQSRVARAHEEPLGSLRHHGRHAAGRAFSARHRDPREALSERASEREVGEWEGGDRVFGVGVVAGPVDA